MQRYATETRYYWKVMPGSSRLAGESLERIVYKVKVPFIVASIGTRLVYEFTQADIDKANNAFLRQ